MRIECDYLVIGSGLAGLTYALKVADSGGSVVLVTKKEEREANTFYAQGGISSVLSPEDSFASHIEDTLVAGAGLCKREAVEACVENAPEAIKWLIENGVSFDKGDGPLGLHLTREGGHTHRRIVHATDITGRAVQLALMESVEKRPNIRVLEDHCAVDLLTKKKHNSLSSTGEQNAASSRVSRASDARPSKPPHPPSGENACLGAYVLNAKTGEVHTVIAKSTCLSTGGSGKVYLYTTNPDVASGDGVAMAFRAGLPVANMEFFQFHPTCLYHPHAKSFLISEALRGEGGVLKRLDGRTFMEKVHPMASLAPRDIVARAIDAELKRTGDDSVVLDMTHLDHEFLPKRFPNIFERCLTFGIDMRTKAIPVVPAAHYQCGGVVTDLFGQTEMPGLYACGEVACTGLHGANRLASNSLLEGLVFGDRAAQKAKEFVKAGGAVSVANIPDWDPGRATTSDEAVVITQNWDEIRRLMWNYVGIVRSDKRLERARRRLTLLQEEVHEYYWYSLITRDLLELRNLALVSRLIVESALQRRESRGLHYTIDCPDTNPAWVKDTVLRRGDFELP
jgi:L-aspartate oxidase